MTMEEGPLREKTAKKVQSTNPFEEPEGKNPFEEEEDGQQEQVQLPAEIRTVSPFHGLISRCFENHLSIFVDGQDK